MSTKTSYNHHPESVITGTTYDLIHTKKALVEIADTVTLTYSRKVSAFLKLTVLE